MDDLISTGLVLKYICKLFELKRLIAEHDFFFATEVSSIYIKIILTLCRPIYTYQNNYVFLVVMFFTNTLPTITGFLSAFCCTLNENQLTDLLIPNKCRRNNNNKKIDDDVPIAKNEIPLPLDKSQQLEIFGIVCGVFDIVYDFKI